MMRWWLEKMSKSMSMIGDWKLQTAGVTLNSKYNKSLIIFLGHTINKDWIQQDPEMVATIVQMTALTKNCDDF